MNRIDKSLEYMTIPEEAAMFKWNGIEFRECSDCAHYEKCIEQQGIDRAIYEEDYVATVCANFEWDTNNK